MKIDEHVLTKPMPQNVKNVENQSETYPELNSTDIREIIDTILQCVSHVSETKFYGITVMTDILRGAHSERIEKNALNKIPEYGKLKKIPREDLIEIIEWLIEKHYLLKTKHPKYPVLHPTYEGMHYSQSLTENDLKQLRERVNVS